MTHSDVPVIQWPRQLFGGFFSRIIAFYIDQLLIHVVGTTTMFGIDLLPLSNVAQSSFSFIIESLIAIGYFTIVVKLTDGWTVGKAIMGLRTVALDGKSLSLSTALIREGIGKMILMHFPFLGIIVLFSEQRENFMDFLTDTRVVSERRLSLIDHWQQYDRKGQSQ